MLERYFPNILPRFVEKFNNLEPGSKGLLLGSASRIQKISHISYVAPDTNGGQEVIINGALDVDDIRALHRVMEFFDDPQR